MSASLPDQPSNANSTRRRHFRAILNGRVIWVALGLALGLTLVGTLGQGDGVGAIAYSALTAAMVFGAALVIADRKAAKDFYTQFAAAHGFDYLGNWNLPAVTPLLGAGAQQRCVNFMRGPLSSQLPIECGLGDLVCELSETRTSPDDPTTRSEKHWFTICTADVDGDGIPLNGMYLSGHRRFGVGMPSGSWLPKSGLEEVSFESSQFAERYKLRVDSGVDRLAVRRLFSPSFIVRLATHPLEPHFEFRGGMLVVYLERKVEDAGHLQWLLEATREIAARFKSALAEVRRSAA